MDQSFRRMKLPIKPWSWCLQSKSRDSGVSLELADALNGRVILMSIRGVNLDSDRGCTAVRVMP